MYFSQQFWLSATTPLGCPSFSEYSGSALTYHVGGLGSIPACARKGIQSKTHARLNMQIKPLWQSQTGAAEKEVDR